MSEKVTITTQIPVCSLILAFLKERNVVYIVYLGWIYLARWGEMRNPQTGFNLGPPSPSRFVFIPIGENVECRGNHEEFFNSQGLNIKQIEIPEIKDNREVGKRYFLLNSDGVTIFTYLYRLVNERTVIQLQLNKEFRRSLSQLLPFIEEVYDWNDLRYPQDTDNPSPRISRLVLL